MIFLTILSQKSKDGFYESVVQLKRNDHKETINIRSKKEIHFPIKAILKGLYQLFKNEFIAKANPSVHSIPFGPCSIDSNGFIERTPIFTNENKDD